MKDYIQNIKEKKLSLINRHFIKLKAMSLNDYNNCYENLKIEYGILETMLGKILIGNTSRGVCYLAFVKNKEEAIVNFRQNYKLAELKLKVTEMHREVGRFFNADFKDLPTINLYVHCTSFQLKVWTSLLQIPFGHQQNYQEIAKMIGQPKASRAVGSAIGKNPIAFIIPCHRVIQASGKTGQYRWGSELKVSLINWENSFYNVSR